MRALSLLPFLVLAACATSPGAGPIVDGGPAAPAGTMVALGQPVWAGPVVVTPQAIVEDSRCPMNARCVWAGRLIVTTRVDGPGWRATEPLTLGEPRNVRGVSITLESATHGKMAGQDIAPGDYRFGYRAQ